MDNLLFYVLKVTTCTTLFYLSFLVFFRKETFYIRNRIFLILSLILPTIFPLFNSPFGAYKDVSSELVDEIMMPFYFESQNEINQTVTIGPPHFNFNSFFTWIYLVVAVILLIKGLISLTSTFLIIRNGTIKNNQFPKVIISSRQHPPFSFFPYAIIPEKELETDVYQDILNHEFAHIRQGHTFDLLLSELYIAFQWFNPIVWLLKNSMILNHEYLADQVSMTNRCSKEYQYRLLNFKSKIKNLSLAHTFNNSIKNRIIMINKKPTLKYFAWKNVIALLIIIISVFSFSTSKFKYLTPVSEPLIMHEAPIIFQNEEKVRIQHDEQSLSVASVFIPDTKLSTQPDSSMIVKMEVDTLSAGKSVSSKISSKPERFNNPLFIKDGTVTGVTGVAAIKTDPSSIESITVIRGEAALLKYGEKALNGAIEIKTRKVGLTAVVK